MVGWNAVALCGNAAQKALSGFQLLTLLRQTLEFSFHPVSFGVNIHFLPNSFKNFLVFSLLILQIFDGLFELFFLSFPFQFRQSFLLLYLLFLFCRFLNLFPEENYLAPKFCVFAFQLPMFLFLNFVINLSNNLFLLNFFKFARLLVDFFRKFFLLFLKAIVDLILYFSLSFAHHCLYLQQIL